MTVNLFSLLAVFAASVLGAMGLGGGSVLLLYLSLATSLPQAQCQALNLLLFAPTAALSLVLHCKHGLVDLPRLWRCLPGGLVGCAAGSLLANTLDPSLLRRLFGALLLVVGLRELSTALRLLRSGTRRQKNSPPPA